VEVVDLMEDDDELDMMYDTSLYESAANVHTPATITTTSVAASAPSSKIPNFDAVNTASNSVHEVNTPFASGYSISPLASSSFAMTAAAVATTAASPTAKSVPLSFSELRSLLKDLCASRDSYAQYTDTVFIVPSKLRNRRERGDVFIFRLDKKKKNSGSHLSGSGSKSKGSRKGDKVSTFVYQKKALYSLS